MARFFSDRPDSCCGSKATSNSSRHLLLELMSQGGRVACAVTEKYGGAGNGYVPTVRPVQRLKMGLVLTPTSSLRASYVHLHPGWVV